MRRLCTVLAAAVALAATGCKKDEGKKAGTEGTATPPAQPKPVDPKPAGPTAAQTLERFTKCKGAINARDLAAIGKCYAGEDSEMVVLDAGGEQPTRAEGSTAIAGFYKQSFEEASESSSTPQLTLAGPSWVAAINLDTAKSSGGKSLSVFVAQLVWFDDSLGITRDLRLVDQATLAAQLGKVASPNAPASEQAWAEPIVVEAKPANKAAIDTNVQIVENVQRAMVESVIDTISAHLADDVSFRYVPHKAVIEGKQAYVENITTLGKMFSKMERKLLGAMGAGDWVVAHSLVTATPAEDLPGAPGSAGKSVTTHQIELYKLVDGAIAQHWVFENSAQWGLQLGASEAKK